MSSKKANYSDSTLEIEDILIPIRTFYERRRTVRVSLGKNYVILRIPMFIIDQTPRHLETARVWLVKIKNTKPELLHRYNIQGVETLQRLIILEKDEYQIHILEEDRKDGELNVEKFAFILKIPREISDYKKRILIRNLLSKIVAGRYKKLVWERLEFWNQQFFKKKIHGLTLRYNSTNWGSCSSTGKINISTRSLLLPMQVFDYILVHELSHLVEMNHSSAFWKVVENVMPDYEACEDWIKKYGSKLDF